MLTIPVHAMVSRLGASTVPQLTNAGGDGASSAPGFQTSELDKFAHCGLTPVPASEVSAPLIEQSPLSLECRVKQILPLQLCH